MNPKSNKMKKLVIAILLISSTVTANSQNEKVSISFFNDSEDVYHLALIFFLPDGSGQTRVSDLEPMTSKKYDLLPGSSIFIADYKQEAWAMQGNDIRTTGTLPWLIVKIEDDKKVFKLSEIKNNSILPKKSAEGEWIIDLRPNPDSEPYLKEFKIIDATDSTFNGEFYGYPFSGGFLNTRWDKICFGFVTSDQTSTYYHSGYVEGEMIYGITLNEQRKFVMPWRGKRKIKN